MFKLANVNAEIERAKKRMHRRIDGAKASIRIEGGKDPKAYKVRVGEYEVDGIVSIEFEIHPRIHQPVVVIKAAIERIDIETEKEN